METTQREKVIDFLNTTTNEQQLYLLQCIADKMSVNIWSKKGIVCHDIKDAFFDINLNGLYIDINIRKD
mgnify:FL=1